MNRLDINKNKFVVFRPNNGVVEFGVAQDSENDTVWAIKQQIMDLFGKARKTVSEHLKNIYSEGKLDKISTWREFRQIQREGDRGVNRKISVYNLDVSISRGYRVKSKVGVEFRKWGTIKLNEHFIQGISVDQHGVSQLK
jgi:hypothetical protein